MTKAPLMTRRGFAAAAAAFPFAAPGIARAATATPEQVVQDTSGFYHVDVPDNGDPETARHNISSFESVDWRDHFDQLGKGIIVADTVSRVLHFWSGDGQTYKLYPTSVPRSDELTKRGYTKIVRKKENPTWTPTASMHARFDNMPDVVQAGPSNPLGVRALYLSWPAYLIHGTHDTRKIGRQSSDGCIGLYNEQITELYDLAPIGTQVRLI